MSIKQIGSQTVAVGFLGYTSLFDFISFYGRFLGSKLDIKMNISIHE